MGAMLFQVQSESIAPMGRSYGYVSRQYPASASAFSVSFRPMAISSLARQNS